MYKQHNIYLELFFPFLFSLKAVLIAVLARDDGFSALFGIIDCLILKTVQAVPRARSHARSPAFVTSDVFAPYLQNHINYANHPINITLNTPMDFVLYLKKLLTCDHKFQ